MANRNEAPEVIMFVRHGEKPGEGSRPHGVNHHGEIDEHSLSVQGWTRAGALAGLFAHAPSRVPSPCRATGPNIRNPAEPRSEEQARDAHRESDSETPED